MVYKDCLNYDGDRDCHKCCSPNHDTYIFCCPYKCEDYCGRFGHTLNDDKEDIEY